MPSSSQDMLSALNDFSPIQNLRVTLQCASLAPINLVSKPLTIYNNDLQNFNLESSPSLRAQCNYDIHDYTDSTDTWTNLIPKTSHVCMLPKPTERGKECLKRWQPTADAFHSYIPPIKWACLREPCTVMKHESGVRFCERSFSYRASS